MGRKKDEELQRQYAQRKQEDRRAFLRNISLCAAGLTGIIGAGVYGLSGSNDKATTPSPSRSPTPTPTPKLLLSSFTHPSAQEVRVYRAGDKPIVFIPFLHPMDFGRRMNENAVNLDCLAHVRSLATSLYDNCGINGFMLEGYTTGHVVHTLRQARDGTLNNDNPGAFLRQYRTLLTERQWIAEGSEQEGIMNPLRALREKASTLLEERCAVYDKNCWADSVEIAKRHEQEIIQDIQEGVVAPYARSLENYLAQDPDGRKAYAQWKARDDGIIKAAQRAIERGANGCILVLGSAHEPNMLKLLDNSTRPYTVVRPIDTKVMTAPDDEAVRKHFLENNVAYGHAIELILGSHRIRVPTRLGQVYARSGIIEHENAVVQGRTPQEALNGSSAQ